MEDLLKSPVDVPKIVFITGLPGVGKTTLVAKVCEHYKAQGVRIAGVTTREVRKGDSRVGFRITDLSSGEEGWLARAEPERGPRVGKYTVASADLERIGVKALEGAGLRDAGLIVVDEIGPMEMTSAGFRKAVSIILVGETPVLAVVRYGSSYWEVRTIKEAAVTFEITKENREVILQKAISKLDQWIEGRGG